MGRLCGHKAASMIAPNRRVWRAAIILALFAVACTENEQPGEPTDRSSPGGSTEGEVAVPSTQNSERPTPSRDRAGVEATIEGPTTAVAGAVLTYKVSFQVKDIPASGIVVTWFGETPPTYVASRLLAGEGEMFGQFDWTANGGDVRWGVVGEGVLELTLRMPDSVSPGTLRVGCYEPGVGGGGCPAPVTTEIRA